MNPQTERITLVASIGISPAVLTEAFYVLFKERNLLPEKITILTTGTGRNIIDKELFHPGHGKMGALMHELRIPMDRYPAIQVIVPELNGQAIMDIRNKEEDEIFASKLIEVMRSLTKDGTVPVYGLLSGGRKTMSAHMHSVFQLMGRQEDRLIHVLVDPLYEVKDFYFPGDYLVTDADGNKRNARDATLELVESPFIALRNLIRPPLDFTRPFSELVLSARKRLKGNQHAVTSLYVNLSERRIFINDKEIPINLPPRPLSLLAFFAFLNHSCDKICPVSFRTISENPLLLELMESLYKFITNKDMELDPWFMRKKDRMRIRDDSNLFARSRNELIRKLDAGLKMCGITEFGGAEVFINDRITNRDNTATANKLLVPGASILFREEDLITSLQVLYPESKLFPADSR